MREIISSGLHSITLATRVRRILFSFCLRTAQKWTRRPLMEEHRWWELLRAQERLWWNCLFPKGTFGNTTSVQRIVVFYWTCNLHVNFSTIVELGEWCLIDGGAKSKMNRACRISVTTLWAASTRHRHSEKTMETKNAHRMLTLKKRRSGGPGENLTRSLQQRKTSGMTWHPKQSCKNNECYALAQSPRPSRTPPWGRLLTSSLVLRITLPKLHLATFSIDFHLGRFWMVWTECWCNYISSH